MVNNMDALDDIRINGTCIGIRVVKDTFAVIDFYALENTYKILFKGTFMECAEFVNNLFENKGE